MTATVAMGFLIVVLLVAATSPRWVAVATSFAAVLAFNFFFLPPVGTLTITDPQNWMALFALLTVSLVASNLSAVARTRTSEAIARRDELGRLFDLSRDVLLIADSQAANAALAGFIARRFDLDYAAICMPEGAGWAIFEAGSQRLTPHPEALSAAFSRVGEGHQHGAGAPPLLFVPLRLGARPIGLLAVAGRPIEGATFDAVAALTAIAIERAQFLDDRKAADLARQSEALKSALLASLGHDLRTPLTAIRVAASNLQASWPDERERREQSDLILMEVDRLTRLFQNILEMARIDAGAVTEEARWVAPAEIVEAARSRVERTLRGHAV
jgi:two-component system sensor histidine kinase KdpD